MIIIFIIFINTPLIIVLSSHMYVKSANKVNNNNMSSSQSGNYSYYNTNNSHNLNNALVNVNNIQANNSLSQSPQMFSSTSNQFYDTSPSKGSSSYLNKDNYSSQHNLKRQLKEFGLQQYLRVSKGNNIDILFFIRNSMI